MNHRIFNTVCLLLTLGAVASTVYLLNNRQYPLPQYFDFRLTDDLQDVCSQDSSFVAYYSDSAKPRRLIFTAAEKTRILNVMLKNHFWDLPDTIQFQDAPSDSYVRHIVVNYHNYIKGVSLRGDSSDDPKQIAFESVWKTIADILKNKKVYQHLRANPTIRL